MRPDDHHSPASRPGWRRRVAAVAAGLILSAGTGWAASPRTGDMAISFAVGADTVLEERGSFHSDQVVSLSVEMHWTAAKSIRGTLGSLDVPARDGSGRGDVSGIYLNANFSYNWFRKAVFPYVTVGLGIYSMEERTGSRTDDDRLEAGVNAGGGVEFRLHSVVTLRLEGIAHAITGPSPRALAVGSLGVKFYF